jgi:hypothetical protein
LSELAKIFRTKEVNAMDALGRIIAACKAAGVTPADGCASLIRLWRVGHAQKIWRTRNEFARDLEEIAREGVGVEYRGQRYRVAVGLARIPDKDAFRLQIGAQALWYWTLRFIPVLD